MRVEIIPLEKVVIDGASVALGAEKAAVEETIGRGQQVGNRHYYFNANLAVDYDAANRVEFIEFLGSELNPIVYGVPAFETDADDLAAFLSEKNGPEINDLENGYSLTFLNLSVGLYRESMPNAVREMIEEMKAAGLSTDDNEDVQEELRKAHHWATIGMGVDGYYKR